MITSTRYTVRRRGRDGQFFHIVDMRGRVVAFATGLDKALKKRFELEAGLMRA